MLERTEYGYIADAEAIAYMHGISVVTVRRILGGGVKERRGRSVYYRVTPPIHRVLAAVPARGGRDA